MKFYVSILFLLLSIFAFLLAGCGGSDSTPTGGGGGTTISTITANTTVSAPTMSSAHETVWNNVNGTILDLEPGGLSKANVQKSAVATQIAVQAINKGGKLFLRFSWADADNSLNREPYVATDPSGYTFTHYDGATYGRPYAEDQLFVMFEGAPGGGYDTWNWRSLTTGKCSLAEGLTYNNGTFTADAGGQIPAINNTGYPNANYPKYIHTDSPNFTGEVLYIGDAIPFEIRSGWGVGQTIPGYVIDTSVLTNLSNFPQSHWDIQAVDNFGGSSYTLVLARNLNTGYSDDLDMSSKDTLKVRITVLENEISFNPNGGSNQRSTATFNLVL